MAISTLATPAKDKSFYGVQVSFTDTDGTAVTPSSITWTLTDSDGTVINSREDVAVATPASTITIVLSGDDLDHSNLVRSDYIVLHVEAVVDSLLGNNLPFRDAIKINVDNLIGIS